MEEKILIKADFVKFRILIAFLWTLSPLSLLGFTIWAIDTEVIEMTLVGIVVALIVAGYAALLGYILKKRELVVTNKRVISKKAFGFRRDIPIEKITSVSTRMIMGVGCASPSSKIMFPFCKNKKEIFDTISFEVMRRDSKYI